MPYLSIDNFVAGMDLRKSVVTAPPGSARMIRNGYVNAGGEIEKRMAFTQLYALGCLEGTYGLGAKQGQLYVFRGLDVRPDTLPPAIGLQAIDNSFPITRITSVEVFNEKFYVVAELDNGSGVPVYEHYYDGVRVTQAPSSITVLAHRSKIYTVAGNVCQFSMVDDPMTWTPGPDATGAGFIVLDSQEHTGWAMIGLCPYYNQLALFGRFGVQLWSMDEDPAQNQIIQTVDNVGLIAPNGRARFATGDVLFLCDSGIRSLRARDSSNAASVSDIGAPMDEVFTELVRAAREDNDSWTPRTLLPSQAVVEPRTGQFWISIGSSIYVLSTAPSSHISAWSQYDLGFPADYVETGMQRVHVRSGDNLYLYGGTDGKTYDGVLCEVVLPFVSASTPATTKTFHGMDCAIEGTWTFEVGTDPSQPNARETVATVTGPSFSMQQLGLQNQGTHIGMRATTSDPSRARLGQAIFHFDTGEAS